MPDRKPSSCWKSRTYFGLLGNRTTRPGRICGTATTTISMNASNHFYYSLLRYCDVRREESLVIGVLLIFPTVGVVRFIHPDHLGRLQAAFPGCPVQTIRDYFEGFDLRAAKASRQSLALPASAPEAARFIAVHFLTEDASALQFSEPRTVTLVHDDLDLVARNFYDRYLQTYQPADIPV